MAAIAQTKPVTPPVEIEPMEPDEEVDDNGNVVVRKPVLPSAKPQVPMTKPQTPPATVKPQAAPKNQAKGKPVRPPVNDGVFPSTESDSEATDPKELTERADKEAEFELLKGDLPCLDSSASCIKLLTEKAIANSPTIKGLDAQITQNTDNVKAIAKAGEGNIFSAIQPLTPLIPFLTGVPLLGIGTAIGTVINSLAGNVRSDQNTAQNNATLQIRVAEIERTKLQVKDKIEDSVIQSLVIFDNLRVEADISVAIANRESSRFKLTEIGYRLGEGDTNSFIALQNNLDRTRVQVTRNKAALRIQAAKIKRIVLGDEGS